ncbi:MAG: benzoyl-CoA reductase subunit A [Deltaproteobacteria bacterium]|nr:benzoyl-CoA reductase subunit A [Deltaproteobacteria bacterium]
MRVAVGIDLGSTTTKAVVLDEGGEVLGRGITNSRSNYSLAADLARDEAIVSARFTLLERELEAGAPGAASAADSFHKRLRARFRRRRLLAQLARLRDVALEEVGAARLREVAGPLGERLARVFDEMEQSARRRLVDPSGSDFFRDLASSEFSRTAERHADREVPFDALMGVFDKSILRVENTRADLTFKDDMSAAFEDAAAGLGEAERAPLAAAIGRVIDADLTVISTIGTGYGRQRLPFPKESIRSEILCHGLGAHAMFPRTATVLDIGGQDTKAIQVDPAGIVTSFQMNDRCAAGCGRYLGSIADEMSVGVHELGPMAMQSTRSVKISSTCTVFAGAELRDRLSMGQRREDILAGLHRAIILRAMALLARSGGVSEELTFTGGVAGNAAAVRALRDLVRESYGERTINISPSSIYTGALGAALFALRAADGERAEARA